MESVTVKCPNCDFIEKDEAFGQPPTCPKCGAIYEKALVVRAARDRLAKKAEARRLRGNKKLGKEAQPAPAQPDKAEEEKPSLLARGIDGAKQGIADSRAQRNSQGQLLYTADGQPVLVRDTETSKGGCLKIVLMALGFLALLTIVRGCSESYTRYSADSASPELAARYRQEREAANAKRRQEDLEFNRQYQAKKIVQSGLKDPYSAKFKNQKGMCGEVNSKNSFGAYTGFKRFFVYGENQFYIDDGSSVFEEVWIRGCM